jgi:NitT/TauT family transport system substrate-binding protein
MTIAEKCLSAVAGLALAAFCTVAHAQQVPVTLSTGWVLSGDGSPLILAEKRGYFTEAGVTKVAAGTYQAGTGYLPALVQATAKDPSFDAVAVFIAFDASPDGITGPKKTGIAKPADLKGRKISTQPNSTTKLIFELFAKATSLDPASIQWVEVAPNLIGVTVQQGQADGAAQFTASASANFARLGFGPNDLYQFKFSDYVDNLYGNALILKKSWAAANPAAAKGVVRAYIKGLIDARKDPKAAIDALMAKEPLLTRAAEEGSLDYSNANYFFTKNVLAKGLGYQTKDDVAKFVNLLAKPFELSRIPAAAEVYTDAYLPAADERMVK